ncbi:MAG: YebC/PmpR family DNA-binding transcriptional regulator [Nannocystaceae bacterium]
MSGHSKWSTIKRKKALVDAKKGKIFTKLAREITIAAKEGGGDPDGNPRLRLALLQAKAANMPKDNQERAIQKGTGELGDVTFEPFIYEGRGPGGSCFILTGDTDNRNRTVAEIRHTFSKHGGELSSNGAVSWMFDYKGVVEIDKERIAEDVLMERALGAGAEDIQDWDSSWGVLCEPSDFSGVEEEFRDLEPDAEVRYLLKPENELELDGAVAVQVAKLWALLDEHDDVQKTYANVTIPDEIMDEHGP